jgi:hypothetical protein
MLSILTSPISLCAQNVKEIKALEPLWKNKIIGVKEILKIGTDDFEKSENYYLGGVKDFKCDRKNNVYILDSKNKKISVFGKNGKFVKSHTYKKGQGPGDFVAPFSLDIGPEGNIYIADRQLRRITILSPSFQVKKIIKIKGKGMLFNISCGLSAEVFFTKSFHMEEYRISKLITTSELIRNFCKDGRDKRLLNHLYRSAYAYGHVHFGKLNRIFFSFGHPYRIKMFSAQLKLTSIFSREANFKGPDIAGNTVMFRKNSSTRNLSTSTGISTFPDGKIINLIRHIEFEGRRPKFTFCFDIFNKDGHWLGSIPGKKLKCGFISSFEVDWDGFLYVYCRDPFPHLKKLKIIM